MDGGAAVRLRQDEKLVLTCLGTGVGGQPLEGRADRMPLVTGVVRIGPQDPEPGTGYGGQRVVSPQLVLAVAEEGEVVVREPAQQFPRLLDVLVAQVVGGRLLGQLLGDAQRGVAHLLPVLDGLTGVGQHAQQVVGDLLQVGAVGLAVDLDMDPRLDVRVVRQLAAPARRTPGDPGRQYLDELAGQIPSYDELRMDDEMDTAPLPGQLVGDRVDEEGHVVGDDLDDGVAARPAVLLDGRGVHPHARRALRTGLAQPVVREGGAEDVDRVAVGEVLRGCVQVVALEEREHGVVVRVPGSPPDVVSRVVPVGSCPPTGLFSATRAALSSSSALASSSLVCIVLWLLSRAVA